MHHKAWAALPALALIVAACGGPATPSSVPAATSPLGPQIAIRFTLPSKTVGGELPSEGVGTENDPVWGTVGGYTQSTTAQVLAFKPGVTITFTNLSKSISHTLNVVKKVKGPPAHFPANPSLPTQPMGNGVLGVGFASGTLGPGKSVSIQLLNKGNYLIGCAFHYHEGMQDVIRVNAHATPGPTK
jgi:plastocyanin